MQDFTLCPKCMRPSRRECGSGYCNKHCNMICGTAEMIQRNREKRVMIQSKYLYGEYATTENAHGPE